MSNILNFNGGSNIPPNTDYKKFSVNYRFEDKNWCFEIWAKTKEEAEKRVSDIKHFPVEVSEVIGEY
jgi:hypothetical protein